jgi:GTPase
LFERPQIGEQAILVHVDFGESDTESRLAELNALAQSAGAVTVSEISLKRRSPDPKYFVGRGKADEILDSIHFYQADLVIFDHDLSPSQERNLEENFSCRVLSRTGLILDIFAQRAQTFEGKLQVELAQLSHLSTRLVRGWTHLERQKGGIGLRGPGETQLETDRRLIGARIKQLQQKLAKVRNQRSQGRLARQKAQIPTISLVGYTNAGKSTLFNVLSNADVYVQDQLFATLDPTLRKISLTHYPTVILADTVGFIRDLPHDLVESFRSTLQETIEADLLLHVIDCAHPEKQQTISEVQQVLNEIGAGEVPVLEVYNKIDQLENATAKVEKDALGKPTRVWLSAHKKQGMEILISAIEARLSDEIISTTLRFNWSEGQIRAALFAQGFVDKESSEDENIACFSVTLRKSQLDSLLKKYPAIKSDYQPEKAAW